MPSLLEKIKAGARNRKEIKFPGTDIKVALRVLSNQDTLDAALAADRLYKAEDIPVGMQNIGEYESEKTTQQLYRALSDPENGGPIAPSITEFRKNLTPGERAALIEEYNAFDAECNPSPDTMPADEFDRLVEDVKKKPEATIGNISSMHALKRLALFLACPPSTSPKGNGRIS
jgi:hypothetical protein